MVTSNFPCEWNVIILHKSNQTMKKNYQANYLRRQKEHGLHSKDFLKNHKPQTLKCRMEK